MARYRTQVIDDVRVAYDVDYRVMVVDDAGRCLLTLGTVRPAPNSTRQWRVVSELEGTQAPRMPQPTQREGIRDLLSLTAWGKPAQEERPMCAHGIYLDGACAECREERTGVPERDADEARTDPPEHLEQPDSYRGPDGVLGNDFNDKGW